MIKKILGFQELPELSTDVKNVLSSGKAELFQFNNYYVLVINSNIFLKLNSNGKMESPINSSEFNKEIANPVFLKPLTFSSKIL